MLESVFGDLPYEPGDYVVIHRNILHRWRLDAARTNKFVVFESRGHVRWPKRYRNEFGQLLEGAPYSRARHPPARRAASRTTRRATFRSSSSSTTRSTS